MIYTNTLLDVRRLSKYQTEYPEIKDPSVVFANGQWQMYASIGRSTDQQWIVGRFVAEQPEGPWQEVDATEFDGISGPQLCAPAVLFDTQNGTPQWNMYIQTACFEENGVIVEARSDDGHTFSNVQASVVTREHIQPNNRHEVVGVYDAGISTVQIDGEEVVAMIFSGYRRVGSGDIYLTWKKKNDPESTWALPQLILEQESVPFHNHPTYESYEWGLEGGKIEQLDNELFMLVGVCFLPMPKGAEGTRQRVFFAASIKLDGPYIPLGTPFPPQRYEQPGGEHGHPDTFIYKDKLIIIYQERRGESQPWHLRYATLDLKQLKTYAEQTIAWSPLHQIHQIVTA